MQRRKTAGATATSAVCMGEASTCVAADQYTFSKLSSIEVVGR